MLKLKKKDLSRSDWWDSAFKRGGGACPPDRLQLPFNLSRKVHGIGLILT